MENRKEQIISFSIDFIKKYGFDSFSYKDLSEAVGITKATLHHHFPKKEDLGLAVCKALKENGQKLRMKTDGLNTAKEKLRYIFDDAIDYVKRMEICPLCSLQAEYNVIPDSMKKMVIDLSEREIDFIAQILQEGIDEGSFEFKGNPRSMALMILTSYKGSILYSRTINGDIITLVLQQIYDQIIK
ncbi:MAG: TetR/AcrR family transcriptional regulator [Maledivibacter sp.]|jgi:TetR/AcrR family transcriptional repressor of nem operon|nr:TetR/AcrR family transcriptional regulator [Maledivibacter sp.]MCT4606820.1 TetR/AcrR family transcriptional regulator [Marinisporobacter sp.]